MTALPPPKYLILPAAQYMDYLADIEEAKTKARELTQKYGLDAGAFVVIEAKFVGMFEPSAPIWNDLDPAITYAKTSDLARA